MSNVVEMNKTTEPTKKQRKKIAKAQKRFDKARLKYQETNQRWMAARDAVRLCGLDLALNGKGGDSNLIGELSGAMEKFQEVDSKMYELSAEAERSRKLLARLEQAYDGFDDDIPF